MLRRTTPGAILPGLLLAVVASIAHAQSASPEDANVNAIRKDANIGQTGEWYIAEYCNSFSDRRNRHGALHSITLANVNATDFSPSPDY